MKNVGDDRRATRLVTAPPWAARVPGLDLPEVHRVKSRADHGRAGRREVGGTPCQPTNLAGKTIGAVGPRMAQGKPQAPTARGQENAGGRSLDDQAELLGHIDGKHQVPAITATRDLGPRQHAQRRNTDELPLDPTSQHEVGGGEHLDVRKIHALRIMVHRPDSPPSGTISVDTLTRARAMRKPLS